VKEMVREKEKVMVMVKEMDLGSFPQINHSESPG